MTIAEAIMADLGATLAAALPGVSLVFTERPSEDLKLLVERGMPAAYVWEHADQPSEVPHKSVNTLSRELPISTVVWFEFDPLSREDNLRAKGRRILGMIQAGYAADPGRGQWNGAPAVGNASDTTEGSAVINDSPVENLGYVQIDHTVYYMRSFNDPTTK
jgi:hypothetical protein